MADAAMVFHLKVQVLMDMAHGHCSEEKWGWDEDGDGRCP